MTDLARVGYIQYDNHIDLPCTHMKGTCYLWYEPSWPCNQRGGGGGGGDIVYGYYGVLPVKSTCNYMIF